MLRVQAMVAAGEAPAAPATEPTAAAEPKLSSFDVAVATAQVVGGSSSTDAKV